MVYVDRWLILGIIGIIGMIVSATGEFLGWWDEFGEWSFWLSLALTILGLTTNATRGQGREILEALRQLLGGSDRVEGGLGRVEQGIGRVEQGLGRVEQGIGRVEQGLGRVEQGVARVEVGVGRVEANTAETNVLLRDIRDRLPPPRA